jgi:putative FmdB family regulatory protein
MPTYEYEREKCGLHFDRFQTMSEEPVKKCPKCGGQVRRLIGGGSGIIFKGHGFYATDYARGSNSSGCWTKPIREGAQNKQKKTKNSTVHANT